MGLSRRLKLLTLFSGLPGAAGDTPAGLYTDFSEYPSGQKPNDWTERIELGGGWQVEDDAGATGGKVLTCPNSTNFRNDCLAWDILNNVKNILLECRVMYDGTNSLGPAIFLRGKDDTKILQGMINVGSSLREIRRWLSTSNTGTFSSESMGYQINTWFRIKIRVIENDVDLKIWKDSDPEPELWDSGVINTPDLYTAGWHGLCLYTDGNVKFDWFRAEILD